MNQPEQSHSQKSQPEQPQQESKHEGQEPGPVDVVKSVAAAMFGVQSEQNRERDFTKGKPTHFIIAGIIMTVLFVLTLLTIVSNVVDK